MAKFNMKGKGKKQKLPLETTKTYEAINGFHMSFKFNTNSVIFTTSVFFLNVAKSHCRRENGLVS